MNETTLLHRMMLAFTKAGARVFRNTVGHMWQGSAQQFARAGMVHVEPGDVLIRQARRVTAGLCVGSSDIIGWKPRVITADMVGSTVAAFTAAEVKTQSGRLTTEQARFLNAVEQAGGIAIEARDVEQAVAELNRRG